MAPIDPITPHDPNFAAGLADLPELSLIRVTGRDRTAFLNNFCTNDLLKRRPGQGCEAFVTDAKAHILAHIAVWIRDDALFITSLARQADQLIGHWDRYCISEDVQFNDLSTSWSGFALCGPDSSRVLSHWGLTLADEPWSHGEANVQGFPLLATRLPFSEMETYVVITTADSRSMLQQAPSPTGSLEATQSLFDELRIAAGFPVYGRDISRDNLPQEVNRNDLAISFTRGCYLGQETVARIDALGHVNRL
jgi:folate-binding protein YgfZ